MSDVELSGYAELRATLSGEVSGAPVAVVERVRPRFVARPHERLKVEAALEVGLSQGRDPTEEALSILRGSEVGEVLEGLGCALEAPPRYASASEWMSVERLSVGLELPHADLQLGRQAVRWGSALVFNPTDPFTELLVTEPWKERAGVNAAKLTVPLDDNDLTAVVAVGDDLSPFYLQETERSALPLAGALRATARVGGVDASLVGWRKTPGWAGAEEAPWLVGADLRGTLGVGWWVEGGWHGAEEAPEVVAGIDWSVPVLHTLYLAAEYRYDGTGAAPEDQDPLARMAGGVEGLTSGCTLPLATGATDTSGEASTSSMRSTLGRQYAHASVRLGVTEELSASAVALVALEDGSAMVVPSLGYLAGSHGTLTLGAQLPVGAGELSPDPADYRVEAGPYTVDFSGLIPAWTIYSQARWSF